MRMRTLTHRFGIVAALGLLLAGARAEEIAVKGATIELQVSGARPPDRALLRQWVQNSARAVSTYFGGSFSVPKVTLQVKVIDGHEAKGGQAFGYDGNLIALNLGRAVTEADLVQDWVLPHEMLHLGFPSVPERHHWLEEGMAVYLEPFARSRAGLQTPAAAWHDLVENIPQGLPEKGDRGLDHTHTWGRTYYGGALFCLRADVEIRRRTGNRKGFGDVVRALVGAGGTIEHEWKIDRVMATGDAATGVPVLRELYDEMKDKPVQVDLPALWKQLGIVRHGDTVAFDDGAPLASIRKAIAAP